MARYTVECPSCNETYDVKLYGRQSDRQWRLDTWDWTCDQCRQRQREETNQAAAAANQADGLPPLTGSEKQISWAESIRKEIIEKVADQVGRLVVQVRDTVANSREHADQLAGRYGFESAEQVIEKALAVEEVLAANTSASWWIDHRNAGIRQLVLTAMKSGDALARESAPEAVEAKAAATVRPAKPVSETVAEIRLAGEYLEVDFPEKRDDFWQLIKKELGFTWSGDRWRRWLNQVKSGRPADRLAETGNRLLVAGFIIRIHDDAARQAAIDGNFQPEQLRWIMTRISGQYQGWFAIDWPRDEDFYQAARKITGSKYSKPNVVVPAEHFEQVLDFAETHGFSISHGAAELAESARRSKAASLVAEPVKVAGKTKDMNSGPEPLEVPESVDIDEELRDEVEP